MWTTTTTQLRRWTRDPQAGVVLLVLPAILLLAAVGGALVPVDQLPGPLEAVAPASPAYWALEGYAELLRAGGSVGDVLAQAGVLVAFAAAVTAVALVRLDFERLLQPA